MEGKVFMKTYIPISKRAKRLWVKGTGQWTMTCETEKEYEFTTKHPSIHSHGKRRVTYFINIPKNEFMVLLTPVGYNGTDKKVGHNGF